MSDTGDLRYQIQAENDALRAALRKIVAVLGPEGPACGCAGCAVEGGEALRLAQAALDGPS